MLKRHSPPTCGTLRPGLGCSSAAGFGSCHGHWAHQGEPLPAGPTSWLGLTPASARESEDQQCLPPSPNNSRPCWPVLPCTRSDAEWERESGALGPADSPCFCLKEHLLHGSAPAATANAGLWAARATGIHCSQLWGPEPGARGCAWAPLRAGFPAGRLLLPVDLVTGGVTVGSALLLCSRGH